MATFRSPAYQATHVMQQMQGTALRSVGTVRNYEQALNRVAEWAQRQRLDGGLRAMTPELAVRYLEERGQEVGQKTLDMERQGMQAMMRHVTGKLAADERLPVVKSEQAQALEARAYTPQQAALIASAQNERNGLATEIAHAAGLRAHELLTLARRDERAADPRPALDTKWQGRSGERYTVQGKGGLAAWQRQHGGEHGEQGGPAVRTGEGCAHSPLRGEPGGHIPAGGESGLHRPTANGQSPMGTSEAGGHERARAGRPGVIGDAGGRNRGEGGGVR